MPLKNSADDPQQIAQLLHADKVLRGAAGRSGNSIRITAELIDAATGNAVWSKQFERNATDLLEIEDEIANTIANDVEKALAPGQQPQA